MNRILVIGGTGNVGRHVVDQLRAAGARFRAMTRDPDAARWPSQVEVVRGDLTVPETLDPCLEEVETVFLVWVAPPAAAPAALERIAKHARRLVWGAQIRTGDVVRWPYLEAPTAPTDERDVAAVAVRTLCEEGHAGAEYVVTGPQSLTQAEQVQTIGRAIGRSLRVEEISPDEARSALLPVLGSSTLVNTLLNAWAAAVGQPAFVTSMCADVTGAQPRRFLQWATDHAAEFRA